MGVSDMFVYFLNIIGRMNLVYWFKLYGKMVNMKILFQFRLNFFFYRLCGGYGFFSIYLDMHGQ